VGGLRIGATGGHYATIVDVAPTPGRVKLPFLRQDAF
jgi:hypothetical protein